MCIGTPEGGTPIQSVQFALEITHNFQAKGMQIESIEKKKRRKRKLKTSKMKTTPSLIFGSQE